MAKNNRNSDHNKQESNQEPEVNTQPEQEELIEDTVIEETGTTEIDSVEPMTEHFAVVEEPKTSVKQEVKTTKPGAPVPMDNLELALNKYLEGVKTVKHEEEFAKLQLSLYRKVLEVLNKPSFEEARVGLNAILKFFFQNKDNGMSEVNLFRGAAYWTESEQNYTTFRRLVWIFINTCDPASRKKNSENLSLVMLEKSLNTTQYTNLLSFYS